VDYGNYQSHFYQFQLQGELATTTLHLACLKGTNDLLVRDVTTCPHTIVWIYTCSPYCRTKKLATCSACYSYAYPASLTSESEVFPKEGSADGLGLPSNRDQKRFLLDEPIYSAKDLLPRSSTPLINCRNL
jgi:hypothetical protein